MTLLWPQKKILSVHLVQIAQTLPRVFPPPVFSALWFLDGKGFMDWSTTLRSQGYGGGSHVGSHHLTRQLLRFTPGVTRPLCPDTQALSPSAILLLSTINILIAFLFRLLGRALYFLRRAWPWRWPFHLRKRSNHSQITRLCVKYPNCLILQA